MDYFEEYNNNRARFGPNVQILMCACDLGYSRDGFNCTVMENVPFSIRQSKIYPTKTSIT